MEGRDVGELNEGSKVSVTSTAGNLLSGRSNMARRISWRIPLMRSAALLFRRRRTRDTPGD